MVPWRFPIWRQTSLGYVVTMDLTIECVDVVAVIGGFPVLAGATMHARAGEILLLQGPNGAGKTSLLRLIAGLLPVHSGKASVMGIDLRTEPRRAKSHVGMLGHANGLYGDLTVMENVSFWGATVGASELEIEAAMERMGLAERLANVAARKLSAGQKRRTALACLIARRAGVWLLDEPHSGLDATGRDELDGVLTQAAAAGATILISSHELDRGTKLADRVLTVRGGMCQ
jgi:heme ABC exporter ATP-binding subunit CcmA